MFLYRIIGESYKLFSDNIINTPRNILNIILYNGSKFLSINFTYYNLICENKLINFNSMIFITYILIINI